MSDDRMKLVLKRGAALGNGDRPAGFCLGATTAADFDLISPDNTELAEGVSRDELLNACRNPLLLDLIVKLQVAAESAADAELQGEEESTPEEHDSESRATGDDEAWRALPIDQVPGVTATLAKPFIAAGMVTLGQVWDYGDENKGLRGIPGVGTATEGAMCEAIGKYIEGLDVEEAEDIPEGEPSEDPAAEDHDSESRATAGSETEPTDGDGDAD